ncbi:MAG TPA: cytochrome c [Nitrospirota bacterium]|nr:cytochrome c [Nitrospirota bacterium]
MKNLLIITAIVMLASASGNAQGQSGGDQDKSSVHSITIPSTDVTLKPGPGLDKVRTLCNICHSLEYITMQPALPEATWSAEVNKMIKVMGAPINGEDAKIITEYLSAEYGTGK